MHDRHASQEDAARHRCSNVHLASDRRCLLPERHYGGCVFVKPSA